MISTLRNSSPRATSAWMSGVGVTTIPPRNTRFPDSTTCTAVLASHHVVILHLRMLPLGKLLSEQRLSPLRWFYIVALWLFTPPLSLVLVTRLPGFGARAAR